MSLEVLVVLLAGPGLLILEVEGSGGDGMEGGGICSGV